MLHVVSSEPDGPWREYQIASNRIFKPPLPAAEEGVVDCLAFL